MHQCIGAYLSFEQLALPAGEPDIRSKGVTRQPVGQIAVHLHEFAGALEFPVSGKAISADRRVGFVGSNDFDRHFCDDSY